MAKPIHSMIRVLDEARSVDFYRRAFGMEIADRFALDGFTLVYLRAPEDDFEVELTINHGRTEPYTQDEGYGHLAVVVPDVAKEQARFAADGLNPGTVKEFRIEGALIARFFFVTDPDGYRIEVLERHGRYR
ncbi:MAG: VOC family protein [Rhodopila sp.]|nr:VOC family protein [Rhodopila sp.]